MAAEQFGSSLVPSGSTRTAAVIGSPVRHSRSPLLANAAFAAARADWVMVALEVAEGHAAQAIAAVRTLDMGGLMVTMPHKHAVIDSLDRLTPAAAALGAVNSIYWDGADLVGHNTDGPGLVAALSHDGVELRSKRCVVLGAGGAARSIIWALGAAEAGDVAVLNRTPSKAESASQLAGGVGRVAVAADISEADVIINATSVGMGASPEDQGAIPFDPSLMRAGQVVLDAVYNPLETALLRAAREAGARPIDGLGMLVHQAAITIEAWIGVAPDIEVMNAAARKKY